MTDRPESAERRAPFRAKRAASRLFLGVLAAMFILACSRGAKKAQAADEAKADSPEAVKDEATAPAAAQPTPIPGFAGEKDFSEFASFYYLRPAPDRIPNAIRYYAASPWLEDPDNVLTTALFFGEIFKRDEKAMQAAFDALAAEGSEDAKVFFLHSLWFVDGPAGRALVERAKAEWKFEKAQGFIAAMEKRPPPAFLEGPLRHPTQLDMLWMTFYATGDPEPVRRVISLLHLAREGDKREKPIGQAAAWMLRSNGIRHEKVRAICAEDAEKASGETKAALEEVLKEIAANAEGKGKTEKEREKEKAK